MDNKKALARDEQREFAKAATKNLGNRKERRKAQAELRKLMRRK